MSNLISKSLDRWQVISLVLVAVAALFFYGNSDWSHVSWADRWPVPLDAFMENVPLVAPLLAVFTWVLGDLFLVMSLSGVVRYYLSKESLMTRLIGIAPTFFIILLIAGVIVFLSSILEPIRILILFGEGEGILSGAIFPIWFFVLVIVNAIATTLLYSLGTKPWSVAR